MPLARMNWKLNSVACCLAMGLVASAASGQVVNANECPSATVINGTGTFSFDTRGATASTNPPAFNGSITMNYDVWARWTAPQTGWLTLSTCVGSTQFGNVTVYQGTDCASLVPWAVGDWASACAGDVASFWVNQGDSYTFRLDLPLRTGQFNLSYGTAFPGDECHNAIDIAGTGLVPFDNTGATSQYIAADPYQYIKNDVWYRWTAPESGPTYMHTCGLMVLGWVGVSLFDDACPVLGDEIAGAVNSPGCSGGGRIDFVAEAGRTYLVRIGSTSDSVRTASGQFEIVQVGGGGTGGETIVVDIVRDIVDFTGAQNVDALPGPDGRISFREACMAANNTGGPQRIEFNVPESDWYYPATTFSHATLINASGNAFLLTDDGTEIDGTTQTTNVGDTNPNGPDVGFWSWNPNAGNAPNIIISGNDCVVKGMLGAGLIGWSLWIDGDRNRVIGCVLNQSLSGDLRIHGDDNIIGGTEPGEGNTVQGLAIGGGAQNTVVIGSRIIGLGIGESAFNTRIGGPSVAERNIIAGAGSYCCEGLPTGAQLGVGGDATGTLIENNYIGLAADGVTTIFQTGPTGISLFDAIDTTIRNNVVSECYAVGQNHYAGELFGTGISIAGTCVDTVVQGNLIGTDASGQNAISNLVGIRVLNGQNETLVPVNTLIGGEEPGQGNLIAFSVQNGILVWPSVTGVRILGNRFIDNGGLAIDLGDDGVTPNDAGDADGGANNRQNFPVIEAASANGSETQFSGTLNSVPGREYRIELFASPACDPSGYGEAQEFIGATTVMADAGGSAAIDETIPVPAAVGWVATATATDLLTGDTSELGACVPIGQGTTGCEADFDGDGTVAVPDIFAFLSAWFANDSAADFDGNGSIAVPDIFAFLSAWFAGCN